MITRDQIVLANQMTALDLIRVLRPHWLRRRGSTSYSNEPDIVVYLDGVRIGDPNALADIACINVESIEYFDARRAQYRWGLGHVHGAIEVKTLREGAST